MGLTNRSDSALDTIAGSPDRRIAGSPDRRIAGSPRLRLHALLRWRAGHERGGIPGPLRAFGRPA
ncbi:MAG: hypothetical protein F4142_00425 [Nitrospira sp. SB0675_bin_23]|nr:hypothetical protein [Nitrospira sp. SB0675_bin_23]MYJ22635.1 hypothetical protein [Nitrospira sp. SB0673_bin_12]